MSRYKVHACAAAVAVSVLSLAFGTSALVPMARHASAQAVAQAPANATRPISGPPDFADLVARVAPAVVRVAVVGHIEAPPAAAEMPPEFRGTPFEDFFRRFERRQAPRQQERRVAGQGSGFIIDPSGYIATNNHVVGEADQVRVELVDGRRLDAKVVGADPQTDVALLKVEAGTPLPTVSFGDSDRVRVGQWVLALGNPFGLGGTATAGIVSARGRQLGAGPFDDFIQTDAAINPGNSGGPLFDAEGNAIGINTAIFSRSGGNIGIGFAVPSRIAQNVVDQLRRTGRVERGWLGVSMQTLTPELANALGLQEPKGALIAGVQANSPAAQAQLKAGDVVVSAGGRPVDAPRDLAAIVGNSKPGESLTLTVVRDGRRQDQQVQLGQSPQSRQAARSDTGRPSIGIALAPRQGGPGAVIASVEPGSAAEERGLEPGDVILSVSGREVNSPREVADAVNAAQQAGRPAVALQVERQGGDRAFVALPIQKQG